MSTQTVAQALRLIAAALIAQQRVTQALAEASEIVAAAQDAGRDIGEAEWDLALERATAAEREALDALERARARRT